MPEKPLSYQSIDYKKDRGFIVTAPSWQRIFIEGALAMTDQMVDLDLILEKDKRTISISEATKEKLMTSLLNSILELFEKEKFLARRIVFVSFDGKKIQASLFGEKYDPIRHCVATDIKSQDDKIIEMGESREVENQFYAKVTIRS